MVADNLRRCLENAPHRRVHQSRDRDGAVGGWLFGKLHRSLTVAAGKPMARILAETADAGKGLDYLVKAEGLLDPVAIDERSAIEETRGRVYEKMGNIEKGLDSYVRSFAFRMNPKTMDKIKSMAEKTGKPASIYFAEARKVRETAAQPFKPFEAAPVETGQEEKASKQN